jgi:ABC-type Fe3+ transport system permease subunit
VKSQVNRSPIPNIFLVFAAGISIASLIWYLVLTLLYSLFLHLLWREVPKSLGWVKPPKSWKSILFSWAVSTLAASVPALLLLPYSSHSFYSSNRFSEILEKLKYVEFNEEAIGKMFIGWYVTAAYLYQARSLLKTRPRRTHLKNGN